jgi:CheY-like chemotaxis protein
LLNLGSNAIKYNRPGGRVRISATAAPSGRARITVEDTGPGIPPERQVELFQPFARLGAEHTATEGTGLGLAIAKHLVEAMEGTIGFSSTPGTGSRLWIELPRHAGSAGAIATETIAAPAASQTSPGSHSVLYIEDNPESVRMITQLLSIRPDLAMVSASTPQAGIDLAFAHRPDVVILDLNLPGMSGYDVLARLRSIPETRAIPVLAFTAAAMPSDIRRGRDAGFFRYLTKPIDVNAFFRAIDEAIIARAAARSRDEARPA